MFYLTSRTPGSRQSSPAEQLPFQDAQKSSSQTQMPKPSTPVKPLNRTTESNDTSLMDSLEVNSFDNFPVNYGSAQQNEMVIGTGASSYFNGQAVQVISSQRSQQQQQQQQQQPQLTLAQVAQQQQQQQQLSLPSGPYPGNPYFITASTTQDPYGSVPMAPVPNPGQAQQVVHPQYAATYNVPWGVYQPSNPGGFVQQQQQPQILRTGNSGRPGGNDVLPQQNALSLGNYQLLPAPGTSLNIGSAYYDQSGNVVVGAPQGLATAQLTSQLSQPVRMIQPLVINDPVAQAGSRVAGAPSNLRLFNQQGQQQLTAIGSQGSVGFMNPSSGGSAMSGLQLGNSGVNLVNSNVGVVGGSSGGLGTVHGGNSSGRPDGLMSDLGRRQALPMYGASSSLGSLSVSSQAPSVGLPELQTPPLGGTSFHVGSPVNSGISQYLTSAAPGDRKFHGSLNGLSSGNLYGGSPLSSGGYRGNRLKESNRSRLLEDFRNNRFPNIQLRDLANHIVEFSQDQHGSRFIQQKLERASPTEKQMVFNEILPAAYNLMTDVFGNYVIQKFFEFGNREQKQHLANCIQGHVLPLALQMYGCRVIQKALECIPPDQQVRISVQT